MSVEIDGDKRLLHARIHSAGHLLDTAFSNIGFSQLEPSKVLVANYYSLNHRGDG